MLCHRIPDYDSTSELFRQNVSFFQEAGTIPFFTSGVSSSEQAPKAILNPKRTANKLKFFHGSLYFNYLFVSKFFVFSVSNLLFTIVVYQ